MVNSRCRMHGGKSTGPKTQEGLERARKARITTGFFTKDAIERRKLVRSADLEAKVYLWKMGFRSR